jgi:transposase-like protein
MSLRAFNSFEKRFLNDSSVCPHCKSDAGVTCSAQDVTESEVEVRFECDDCGISWTAVYEPTMIIYPIEKNGRRVEKYSYK